MSIVRSIAAAFAAILGVMLVIVGMLCFETDRAITSGSAAQTVVASVLDDQSVVDGASAAITTELIARAQEATESRAVDLALRAFRGSIEDLVSQALSSDPVRRGAEAGADRLEARLLEELTARDRPSAPFSVSIDVAARLNDRLDQVPLVGRFLPDVQMAPVEQELIDATTFDQVRTAYAVIRFGGNWFVWFGLVGIVIGAFAARRRGWYLGSAALGMGVLALAIAFALGSVAPATIAKAMPGGEQGGVGVFVSNFLSDTALVPFTTIMLWLGSVALLLAIAFVVLARLLPDWNPIQAVRDLRARAAERSAGS
ncbi:hypothetical protein [Demequina sp.]|uniref:hypothetical protein n=1 Tax=Demequina sp. TaxID=2050685 RepID=UPI0025D5FEBC|nr:hypothetical protein [Demequina sp.]